MRSLLKSIGVAYLLCAFALPAWAVSLLRDPDIEHSLKELATPVLNAAGLPAGRMSILVVDASSLNAFVIDREHIFIHAGLLLKLETAEQLQSVIAHEAAHISNGHLARRPANARAAQNLAAFGIALAAAASATGHSDAGIALGIGVQSSAQRSFFSHTRAEEASADQSAIRYLTRAGVDPEGSVQVMDMFAGQELLSAGRQDPYARSHPLSRDRLRAMQAAASAYKDRFPSNPDANYWFARAKGKLGAFYRAPKWTLRRAGESGHKDIAEMRKAIAWHRSGEGSAALSAMERLVAAAPNDPYLHELHGQILLERRSYTAALSAYKKAVTLAPQNALILGQYGHALLVSGNPKAALPYLERSANKEQRDARVLRDLGGAYARLGQNGMASLLTAERYALLGRPKDATLHAKRALGLLKRGSPGWQRAQDVLLASESADK
ncbi:M48 family metalloprotease [uncultured Lentibacter sp.]|uniref:M48 family metalloprotease n=1 Tax=uncultured Lentibacter sp. TaxID=1659309 RepID=UPI002634B8A6|nr:M48 family metalloprotease [uncultured Lentibacter sp.]MCW1955622.1 M48 family metalloprotease [Roseobacter sp.]